MVLMLGTNEEIPEGIFSGGPFGEIMLDLCIGSYSMYKLLALAKKLS